MLFPLSSLLCLVELYLLGIADFSSLLRHPFPGSNPFLVGYMMSHCYFVALFILYDENFSSCDY